MLRRRLLKVWLTFGESLLREKIPINLHWIFGIYKFSRKGQSPVLPRNTKIICSLESPCFEVGVRSDLSQFVGTILG